MLSWQAVLAAINQNGWASSSHHSSSGARRPGRRGAAAAAAVEEHSAPTPVNSKGVADVERGRRRWRRRGGGIIVVIAARVGGGGRGRGSRVVVHNFNLRPIVPGAMTRGFLEPPPHLRTC